MDVPLFVWINIIIFLYLHFIRKCFETCMLFRDEDDELMPESVKHMYS